MSEQLIEFQSKLGVRPNPKSVDKFGFTHLHWAAIDSNTSAAEYLLHNGANAHAIANNSFGQIAKPTRTFQQRMKRFGVGFDNANFWGVRELTPLHIAATLNCVEIMKLLYEHGAYFDSRAYPDLNPVHCALCAGSEKALRALLRNGFDIDAKDQESRTLLHWLAMYEADSRVAIVLGGQFTRFGMKLEDAASATVSMLEQGANLSEQDRDGNTPLHLTAATDMRPVAEVLFAHGAETESRNFAGATPLHIAAWFNSLDTAVLLRDRGAQIDSLDSAGNTPLHIATADDAQDTHGGMIPYGSCCGRRGKNLVLNFLVESGADVSIENNEGHTPLSIAASKPNSNETYELLSRRLV